MLAPHRWQQSHKIFQGTGHPGRRPLVGCNQRRWTRAGRSTVPELAADIGHAGRASKRASSKLRSSSCSPVTSPSASRR